jgi:hypothetical protein
LRPDINQAITQPRKTAEIEDIMSRLCGDFAARPCLQNGRWNAASLVERNTFEVTAAGLLLKRTQAVITKWCRRFAARLVALFATAAFFLIARTAVSVGSTNWTVLTKL